ncbi:hypothetical protein PG996_007783 [Apiospora saccharicola]|uniref:Peptidase S54 rhomboid domain-containing protein n=1 Tax=Apiospora saccharicola TaxID=335842 RepID=A0ABR1UW17_9PEZI
MDAIQEESNYSSIQIFLALWAGISAVALLPYLTLFVYGIAVWVIASFIRYKQWQMEVLEVLFEELKVGLGRPRMSYLQFFKALHGDGDLREQDEQAMSRIVADFCRRRPVRLPTGWSWDDRDLAREKFLSHWVWSLENMRNRRYHTLLTCCIYHKTWNHFLANGICLSALLFIAVVDGGLTPWSVAILATGSGLAASLGALALEQSYLLSASSPDDDPGCDELDVVIDRLIYTSEGMGASGIVSGFAAALPWLLCPQTTRQLLLALVWLNFLYQIYSDVLGLAREDVRGHYRKSLEEGRAADGSVTVTTLPLRVGYAAHLGGAAFGLLFALVKLKILG